MTLWLENLRRLLPIVEAKLEADRLERAALTPANYEAFRALTSKAEADLTRYFQDHEGAYFSTKGPDGHSVRMLGLRATSTSSFTGALWNWRRAAEKKLGEAPADVINLQGSGPAPIELREGR